MNPHTQALVHSLLASQLGIPDESIEDTQTFDALGLDLLDLMFVVLRLEQFDSGKGDFPVAALDNARTVADLVELVQGWLGADTSRRSVA
jgi:acyl carrier protein